MRPPRIFGLAGPAGSGKTTIAKAMDEAWGYERTSFATLMKDLATTLGYDTEALHEARAIIAAGGELDPKTVERVNAARKELGRIADGLRAIDPQAVIKHAFYFADQGIPPRGALPKECEAVDGEWKPKVVFDDVRRHDEVEAIRKRDGVVIWVKGRSPWPEESTPASDQRLRPEDCDWVLDMDAIVDRCDVMRARARRREAEQLFAQSALSLIDMQYGVVDHMEGNSAMDDDDCDIIDDDIAEEPTGG